MHFWGVIIDIGTPSSGCVKLESPVVASSSFWCFRRRFQWMYIKTSLWAISLHVHTTQCEYSTNNTFDKQRVCCWKCCLSALCACALSSFRAYGALLRTGPFSATFRFDLHIWPAGQFRNLCWPHGNKKIWFSWGVVSWALNPNRIDSKRLRLQLSW